MSKRAEKRAEKRALEAYPPYYEQEDFDKTWDSNEQYRLPYIEGYEQAEKDIIASIREQVKQWMPEKDEEEYTDGKRLAFNSVLHLLEEMENYG